MNNIFKNIIRFFLFLVLQVVILNEIPPIQIGRAHV